MRVSSFAPFEHVSSTGVRVRVSMCCNLFFYFQNSTQNSFHMNCILMISRYRYPLRVCHTYCFPNIYTGALLAENHVHGAATYHDQPASFPADLCAMCHAFVPTQIARFVIIINNSLTEAVFIFAMTMEDEKHCFAILRGFFCHIEV